MTRLSSAVAVNFNRMESKMKRKAGGFTLIELMIVVVVIAILTALAYPAYNDQVRKSRRAQAKADLVEYAQGAERHFTVNNSYANYQMPGQSPRQGTGYYTLSPTTLPATAVTTFTLTATPSGDQTNDRCGTLTINNTGLKTKSGSAPLSECW